MKRRHVLLLIAGLVLLILLSIVNSYVFMKQNALIDRKIEHSLSEYENKSGAAVQQIVADVVARQPQATNGIDGRDGTDGTTTTVEKQVIVQQPAEKPKDGKDGEPGRDGSNGKDGRTPTFQVDNDTGDILVKYNGDTLWSLLIEGCKLRKDCEEQ